MTMRILGRPVPPEDADQYAERVEDRNYGWHVERDSPAFFGIAKKVVVANGDDLDLHWRIRTHFVSGEGSGQIEIRKLPEKTGDEETICHDRKLEAQEVPEASITPQSKQFSATVSDLIAHVQVSPASEACRKALTFLHKIHLHARCAVIAIADDKAARKKLEISHSEAFGINGPALVIFDRRTFDNMQNRLKAAVKHFSDGGLLISSSDDTASFLGFLKTLNDHFRNLTLSLPDLTTKLLTKPSTYAIYDPRHLERFSALIQKGLTRLSRNTTPEHFKQFITALTHASRCYNAFGHETQIDRLHPIIDKVVSTLLPLEVADRPALFELLDHVQRQVQLHRDEGLVGTLESLLLNERFANFIEQGQEGPRGRELDSTIAKIVLDKRGAIWRAGAKLMVRRPLRNFSHLLRALTGPDRDAIFNSDKINYIFGFLNSRLTTSRQEVPNLENLNKSSQVLNYRHFLEAMTTVKSLHLIRTGGLDPEQQNQVGKNLNELYRAGITIPADCDRFLSASAFIAAAHYHFDASPLRQATALLLQHNRSSYVENEADFFSLIGKLHEAYRAGLPSLSQVIYSALAEGSQPKRVACSISGKPVPCTTEEWLASDIIPSFFDIVDVVLKCFPAVWGDDAFLSLPNSDGSLVMTPGGSIFETWKAGGIVSLVDPVGYREAEAFNPPHYYKHVSTSSAFFAAVEKTVSEDKVKLELAALISHHSGFKILGLSEDKMEKLKSIAAQIMKVLQIVSGEQKSSETLESVDSASEAFLQRISSVSQFFGSTATFRHIFLLNEAKRRFFQDNVLTNSGRRFLGNNELADSRNQAAIETGLVDRLFEVGYQVAQNQIASKETPAALCAATAKIDSLVRREFDFQAFSTDAVVEAFNARHESDGTLRSCLQVDAGEVEALRQRLYSDSEDALKKREIDYIMPNQALATHLCCCADLAQDNILLKMGTGQGKSVVIAAVAANEASKLQSHQFVFVLTAYDHLARGDHKAAQGIFAPKSIKSTCLTTVEDLQSIAPETKVIYASAKSLQLIVLRIMARQLSAFAGESSDPNQSKNMDFLKLLYNGQHRYILDEFDLVLNDLDFSRGVVFPLPASTLDRSFVAAHRQLARKLHESTEAAVNRNAGPNEGLRPTTDGSDGMRTNSVSYPYVKDNAGHWRYNLSVGALRVSMLLAQAQRIIGLSGSCNGNTFDKVLGLESTAAKYFEMPASRDPDTFETRLVESKRRLDNKPGIYKCREEVIDKDDENAYIDLVVRDVLEARLPRQIEGSDSQTIVRPVLIFVDPDKTELVNRLEKALLDTKTIERAKLNRKFDPADLEGDRLQQMGYSGSVTLVSILCGRGVDIKVSPNIPDSMHVCLATSIVSGRLLTQIIGRTGRMGRDGSYSIVTQGKLISDERNSIDRTKLNNLHHRTKDFIEETQSGCSRDKAKKWLMRTTEIEFFNSQD